MMGKRRTEIISLNSSLTMLRSEKTKLELLWDHEPDPLALEKTETLVRRGMRINGALPEEYLGEENISSVVLPDNIETIGPEAFRGLPGISFNTNCSLVQGAVPDGTGIGCVSADPGEEGGVLTYGF